VTASFLQLYAGPAARRAFDLTPGALSWDDTFLIYQDREYGLTDERAPTNEWEEVSASMNSSDLVALTKVWRDPGTLTYAEEDSLRTVFERHPLGQTVPTYG
jgi:hypothetical protein